MSRDFNVRGTQPVYHGAAHFRETGFKPPSTQSYQRNLEIKTENAGYVAYVAAGAAGLFTAATAISIYLVGGFAAVTLLSGPVGWGLGALVLLIVSAIAIYKKHQLLKTAGLETNTIKTTGKAIISFLTSPIIVPIALIIGFTYFKIDVFIDLFR